MMSIVNSLAVFLIASGPQSWPSLPAAQVATLNEFYHATGGKHWTRSDGWGADSSPCDWFGITCDIFYDNSEEGAQSRQRTRLLSIELPENNLKGVLPPSLANLTDLRSLNVMGNDLSGEIPGDILSRWDRNELDFIGNENRFSNLLARVVIRYTATGVLCSPDEDLRFLLDIRDSGPAKFQSIRCVPGTDRETHCLVREGTDYVDGRLSRALSFLGYRSFQPEYEDGPGWSTHGLDLTTTVWWADGARKTVHTYDRQGPLEVWLAQQLLLSLLSEPYWEREFTQPKCPDVQ